jgi:hypothetical protein
MENVWKGIKNTLGSKLVYDALHSAAAQFKFSVALNQRQLRAIRDGWSECHTGYWYCRGSTSKQTQRPCVIEQLNSSQDSSWSLVTRRIVHGRFRLLKPDLDLENSEAHRSR